ncbi:MAG: 16S rRNA (uracil(1498)-N(3))-methyltransferase [Verrucomicrobia bacterium]|jgi:16S rRNA (uracil1498-N3)-methyltransferase|nr:16S rRNA (uracil(1498)-N(3))-methyltransferase [Verrucomicrobiota bacterium]
MLILRFQVSAFIPQSGAIALTSITTFCFILFMAAYRVFLFPDAIVAGDSLTLDARESHHLVRVLRARVGDWIEVLDGRGGRYSGQMTVADGKCVRVDVHAFQREEPAACRLTLLQSIPKGKTMDLILRMATEIGATSVQPVFTDQGEVQIKGERLASKVEKWRMTMIESCKQCGLAYLPELSEPVTLRDWLTSHPAADGDLRVVASLEAGSRPLREVLEGADAPREVVVAVGPEGDFAEGEYAALREAGFCAVRLGANVLRSETAAAYIMSVVDQRLRAGSEFSGP